MNVTQFDVNQGLNIQNNKPLISNEVCNVDWQVVNELREGATVCINAEHDDWLSTRLSF